MRERRAVPWRLRVETFTTIKITLALCARESKSPRTGKDEDHVIIFMDRSYLVEQFGILWCLRTYMHVLGRSLIPDAHKRHVSWFEILKWELAF